MSKRALIIVMVFAASFGGGYALLRPTHKAKCNKALEHLQANRFTSAEETMRSIDMRKLERPKSLYRAYLAQAQGRFTDSGRYLHQALSECPHPSSLVEALLAQAANAYYLQNDQEIFPLVEAAQRTPASSAFVTFYEGLTCYLCSRYSEALNAWRAFDPPEGDREGWSGVLFERLFPTPWRSMHVAHCLAEEGDILNGRELLEKETRNVEIADRQLNKLATLFLGLTYLKEAQEIPLDQRASFYKLARFYFERSGNLELYPRERGRVITHIEHEASYLLVSALNDNQRSWGFDFVKTLQDWHAEESLDRICLAVVDKLLSEKGRSSVNLCKTIRQEFSGSLFHKKLSNQLMCAVAHRLRQGDMSDLFDVWAMVEPLAESPNEAAKQIACLTSAEIFQTIEKDNKSLKRTRDYLAFWQKLGQNRTDQLDLSRDLLLHAKLLWQKAGQERKGQHLMEIAWNISQCHPSIQQEIDGFLTSLYQAAENSNLVDRMSLVYDAMGRFNISSGDLMTPAKIANHLADANYLFASRNYTGAKTHASWVLKAMPRSDEALMLVGLSAFHLGDYSCALTSLQQIAHLDENSEKALMLSQVFASQEQERHLAQIDTLDSFDEDPE